MTIPSGRRRLVRKGLPSVASNAVCGVKALQLSKDAHSVFQDGSGLFEILNDDILLTSEQLASKLNVALKTIRKWRYQRTMPADCMIKIGRLVRYRWRNVQRWLQLQGD